MNSCDPIVSHISRLEGQLRTLKTQLEAEQNCEKIVPLALSTLKSFDSLRAKMVEHFVLNQLLEGNEPSLEKWEKFQQLLKIIKA